MTDDFRDLLRRSADEAPPAAPDTGPRSVRRGRALRRRRTALSAGGAALACAVVIGGVFAIAQQPGDAGDDRPDPAPAPSVPDPDDLPVEAEDGQVLVSCGSTGGWPPSVMADGVPGVVTDAEATATFAQILADPAYAGEAALSLLPDGPDDVDWRVLRQDDDELTLGLGAWTEQGPGDGALVLGLRREGDRWAPTGWGDCRLAPVLEPGSVWVEVTRSGADPDRAATAVPVRVSERQCTGARDPLPHLRSPVVVEDADAITVYWTSEPVVGGADCQGNPVVDAGVTLDDALGDRALYDGSVYPPRLVVPPASTGVASSEGSATVYVILQGSGLPYLGLIPTEIETADDGRDPGLVAVEALLGAPVRTRAGGAGGTVNGFALLPAEQRPTVDAVSSAEGLITVELSSEDVATTCDRSLCPPGRLVVQQLVWTVQGAYGVDDPVRIILNGEPVREWLGESLPDPVRKRTGLGGLR